MRHQGQWDVFVGLIADVHADAQVLDVTQEGGETYVTLDRMTSTVFNLYSAKAMTLIRGDQPTFAERVSAFFAGLGMRPATAFAGLAIFAVQAGVILNLVSAAREDESQIRALRASTVEDGPMLKLNFAPDAQEAQIRHLLMSVQGRLAGGPGQLGDYYVIVARGQEAAIAAKLKSNPIVSAVTLAPGLPPRE